MNFAWQDILIIVAVLAAAAYVCRRALQAVFGRANSGCGEACGKCSTTRAPILLSLEQEPRSSTEVPKRF